MAILSSHNQTQFQVGDLIRLYLQTKEGARRGSVIEGQILGFRGEGENKSVLLRRVATGGVGVEYIFPLAAPTIAKIELKQKFGTGVRRAKLYFLRGRPKAALDKIARRTGAKGRVSPGKKTSGRKKKIRRQRKLRRHLKS